MKKYYFNYKYDSSCLDITAESKIAAVVRAKRLLANIENWNVEEGEEVEE